MVDLNKLIAQLDSMSPNEVNNMIKKALDMSDISYTTKKSGISLDTLLPVFAETRNDIDFVVTHYSVGGHYQTLKKHAGVLDETVSKKYSFSIALDPNDNSDLTAA